MAPEGGGGEEEAEYPILNVRSEQKDAKPPTPEATARQRDAKEKTGTDWMWQRACRPLNWHPTLVLLHRIGTEQKNAKGAKGGRAWCPPTPEVTARQAWRREHGARGRESQRRRKDETRLRHAGA